MMKPLLLILALFLALPAYAVEPDEVLDDPVAEARAREISQGLRCLVCRNESIDESSADLARDLRLLVRERIVAGDSDAETVDFIVERYGEYVLLRPETNGANLILWLSGPALLIIALGIGFGYVRRRSKAGESAEPLNAAETARLKALLDDA